MSAYTRRELIGLLGTAALAKGGPPPNILFIMADDHAAHAISAYGSRINQTPNIDRIANGGVRLSNCFCTNSICTPSRAAILTGQYSHKNGVYTLEEPLDPKRNHVAKELQRAGYQTAMIGKWHLVTEPTGFDYWNILPGQGVYHNPVFLDRRRPQTIHRLLHRPDRRFHPRLAQTARSEEALLRHVPPQSPAPPLGARPPNIRTSSTTATSPSPTTSSITTKDAPAASPPSP